MPGSGPSLCSLAEKNQSFQRFSAPFRQPAQFEQRLDGGLLFLFTDVGKDSLYRLNGFF